MKRQLFIGLVAVLPAAALALAPATARADSVRCHVPFSFEVRGKTLPPGNYTFSDDAQALLVRGFNDGAVALTDHLDSTTEDQAKVVFEKDGDEYILKEAWMGGGSGRELLLPKPNGERRKSARNGAVDGSGERVAVPAL